MKKQVDLPALIEALSNASAAPGGTFVRCSFEDLRALGVALAAVASPQGARKRGRPRTTSDEGRKRASIAGDVHELRILGLSNAESIREIQKRYPGTGVDTIEKAARKHRELIPLIDIRGDISDEQIERYKARIAKRSKNTTTKSRK